MPAAFVEHGLKRGVMLPTQQARGTRDAPLSVYQSPTDVSGLVSVYLFGKLEVGLKIGEAGATVRGHGGESRGHDPARTFAQTRYRFGILRLSE